MGRRQRNACAQARPKARANGKVASSKKQGEMTQPPTSKSFRAILFMRNEEIDRLRIYCESNFASSAVIQEDQPMVIWLATRDRKRSAQAHRRSARAVLEKLRIPVGKGKWLVLCTDEVVREAVQEGLVVDGHQSAPDEADRTGVTQNDEKIIQLGTTSAARKFSFHVVR